MIANYHTHTWRCNHEEHNERAYIERAIEAMETGYFTYFAHPDLFNFKGPKAVYQEGMRRVCRCAKQMDIPLEINFLGLMEKRNYPTRKFWEIAGEEQNTVIFGSDAHKAKYVVSDKAVKIAMKRFVDKYDLNLIDTVTLRKPF